MSARAIRQNQSTLKKASEKTGRTPAAEGFRMPAEWEPHEATWIAWPHNRSDWTGKFAPISWVYGEIARNTIPGEILRVLVESKAHEASASRVLKRVGADSAHVEFFHIPTNRGWTRDCGPIFVCRESPKPGCAIVKFRFNGWARYPDWRKDDSVPMRAARSLGCRMFRMRWGGHDFVLEGGSVDFNGRGTVLTTEECLLDQTTQVRNPGLDRREVERALASFFGVSNVLWFGKGIAGDDTHGHIDDLARFVGPHTAVLATESDPSDANYRALEENCERAESMRLEDGSKLEVVPLPMPRPLFFDGQRVPASYANFYIANAAVLVPTFNDPNDRKALGLLAELFRDRPVVGIHAVDLVWGLGTLHCLTREQPAL